MGDWAHATRKSRRLDVATPERPRESRWSLNVDCRFMLDVKPRVILDGKLEDFSARGFGLYCRSQIPVGMQIFIEFPGIGVQQGVVLWSFCGRAGGTLLRAIDEAKVLAATAKLDPSSGLTA